MNYREIRDLIDLLKDSDLTEIEVERAGTRIRLRRERAAAPRVEVREVAGAPAVLPKEETPAPAVAAPVPVEEGVIKSPLVGTFYRAAGPDSKPYTDIGEQVLKGQVLCIVEAMKLMNEIEAEYDGTVREIFVENGQPVEYGQPLFRIEPAG